MFKTVRELIDLAEMKELPISEIMILKEIEDTGRSREDIFAQMSNNLEVMEAAVLRGTTESVTSHSGLTGGDGILIQEYLKSGKALAGDTLLQAVSMAVATNEVNAAMGTICATPTAGSAGVVPGVLFGIRDKLQPTRDEMVRFLFTAGAFGFVIANNASISGAAGGCQAEVGSATGMAAAALVEMAGGTPAQSGEALAMALKNTLGLICDPVAGLVEVPCIKRNAMGASLAIVSADMALAGVKSRIPCDEVIAAMHEVGLRMPKAYKETAEGGLAATPTAQLLQEKIFFSSSKKTRS
ncbi:L-serine dehydratase [Pullulanibacillus pueri]|uniref:L-serine dehydratase n=1 Tax=Pullulanibacillus pueri TaxID=1437324 RepID=A0A8J2ZT88_9BACL|nr:L-serine ammonia-lyase, iron-sulfur-dependent, subunit alpha [Pullulanibacillus pueri]MBM7680193.1 L-serine dehydratase [Pullulanibacillus pueri]GGH74825.1 putative L-serine dehydratase, alpha chain [Pullulanibacillus pueri]